MSGSALSQPEQRTIIVGADGNYPPFEFKDENGNPAGYDVDLIKAVAQEMGLKVQIVAGPWGEIRRKFDEGSVDVLSGMFYSKGRSSTIDFSIPHSWITYSIFVRKGDRRIRSENDLPGKKVLLETGDVSFELLAARGIYPAPVLDPQMALKILSEGGADAVISSKVVGLYAMHQAKIRNVEEATNLGVQLKYCFAVRRGQNELLQQLNEGLAVLRYNGVQQRIAEKWLGPWQGERSVISYVLIGAAPVIALLLLAFIWTWTLRRRVRERTASLQSELIERLRAEYRILKLNRLYSVITQVDKAIVRVRNDKDLYQEICKIIVKFGHLPLAWVGSVDEESHSIRPVAHAGEDYDYVANVHASTLGLVPEGLGPSGTAAREGKHCIIGDVSTDPDMGPWKDAALERGYRSNAAFPLKLQGETVAVLTLYAAEPHFFDDAEEIALLDGVTNDISFALDALHQEEQRERAERALQESEEYFRIAFEQAGVGMVLSDSAWKIEAANASFCEMLGYTRNELVGIGFLSPMLMAQDDLPSIRDLAEKLLRGELPRICAESRHIHKDGHLVWAQVVIGLVRDAAGRPLHVLLQLQDITERKLLEGQLLQAQKLETVGRLAGGVAHDFNNLLTVINCHCDLLLSRRDSSGELAESLHAIRSACDQSAALTRQLLAFSRRQVFQPKFIHMNEVVEELKDMLERLIGEDIHFRIILDSGIGFIKADPGLLKQVIINLLVNARDAMPRGGDLTIATGSISPGDHDSGWRMKTGSGPHIVLSISDTGEGMNEEIQRHIFEPFFTTKAIGKGTGLGLSTVWGIIQQSGGSIWLSSESGRGTTFKVCFPQVEVPMLEKHVVEKRVEVAAGNQTILLVEDQVGIRLLTTRILQDCGYRVIAASDGVEALSLAERKKEPIHLVLTDIVMPAMTGIELVRKLRPMYPHLKIIYMSGYTDDVLVRHGAMEPDSAYIEKPFTPSILISKIREVLDSGIAGDDVDSYRTA